MELFDAQEDNKTASQARHGNVTKWGFFFDAMAQRRKGRKWRKGDLPEKTPCAPCALATLRQIFYQLVRTLGVRPWLPREA